LPAFAGTDEILEQTAARTPGTPLSRSLAAQHIQDWFFAICYTSALTVCFMIARPHEEALACNGCLSFVAKDGFPIAHEMKVGRVIARPLSGDAKASFVPRHHDPRTNLYAIQLPPAVAGAQDNWVGRNSGAPVYAVGRSVTSFRWPGF